MGYDDTIYIDDFGIDSGAYLSPPITIRTQPKNLADLPIDIQQKLEKMGYEEDYTDGIHY